MPAFSPSLQLWVLRSGDYPLLRQAYALFYSAAVAAYRFHCRLLPAVLSVSVRRGFRLTGWVPGASDIDLFVVIRELETGAEEAFLRRFWSGHQALKRVFPVLGEVQIVSERDQPFAAEWAGVRRGDYGVLQPPDDPIRIAWERIGEGLNACLFLLEQNALTGPSAASPSWGHSVAKGFLDTLRYAAASDADGRVASRAEQWQALEDGVLRKAVSAPLALDAGQAQRLCVLALQSLDAACGRFIERVKREGLTAAPGLPLPAAWPLDLPNSELFTWKSRMRRWSTGRFTDALGMYYDGGSRWYLLADPTNDRDLAELLAEAAAVHREDPAFRAPPMVLTPRMFQVLLWTSHLDSPFRFLGLSPSLSPLGVAARAKGRLALPSLNRRAQRAQWRIVAEDFIPPPRRLLDYAVRQAAADLARSYRMFSLDLWAGDNAYRLCYLYGRLLNLRLFLHAGIAADPDDLDGLLALCETHLPEGQEGVLRPLRRILDTDPETWNLRPPSECFYEHFPAYRRLLKAVLDAL